MCGAVGLFLGLNATLEAGAPPATAKEPTKSGLVVAPIFEHGKGRGATGCIVVAPPVFLSEEEALLVIREELARHGVRLGTGRYDLPGVNVNDRRFQADAADPARRVAVEFVSEFESSELEWDRQREDRQDGSIVVSSVQTYDLPNTARYLAGKVRATAQSPVYFGTFYDPMAGTLNHESILEAARKEAGADEVGKQMEQRVQTARTSAAAESRRLLRIQVQDFVKWLQGQGAL
jgi:hypothetical protein